MAKPLTEKLLIKEQALKFKNKLQKIKVCAFDIDGILTDGGMTWQGEEYGYNRTYNILDGQGLKHLKAAGFIVGVISGGDGIGIRKRFMEHLKLDFIYLGNEDKRESYLNVLKLGCGYKDEEVLYMGDEFIDAAILKRVGFSATVPNASYEIQEIVDYITVREAGKGAAREVIDMLRYAKGIHVPILEF